MMSWYPWLKSLHLLSVMSWVGGQMLVGLLLWRHAREAERTGLDVERFVLRVWLNPAMLIALVSGVLTAGLLGREFLQQAGWLGWKLIAVLGLTALHGMLIAQLNWLRADRRAPGHAMRALPMIGTLALAAVAIVLAVTQP
jgi:protoporphyrinogen IX oxidase